jgi:hypothetical protein
MLESRTGPARRRHAWMDPMMRLAIKAYWGRRRPPAP